MASISIPKLLFESLFCIFYLLFAWVVIFLEGVRLRRVSKEVRSVGIWLFLAVLALALGDTTHVVPMVLYYFMQIGGIVDPPHPIYYLKQAGILASGVTMTFFYFFMFIYCWKRFQLPLAWIHPIKKSWPLWIAYVLVVARLALLIPPQNDFFLAPGTPTTGFKVFKILRNIPFAALSLVPMGIFFYYAAPKHRERTLRETMDPETAPHPCKSTYFWCGWAIVGSWVCYLGTVVGTMWITTLGVLMVPKTISYVLLIILLHVHEFVLPGRRSRKQALAASRMSNELEAPPGA
eukprot:gnl/Trimastix_PCT/2689.p1 GENE.gnl/Trimastix_PCT/2689~~gnl/Trimastix_PCT/2689.p1  ORF type:complete len:292 (+),score=56.25 gnl/Trimastix_PCT/2689:82-957(+)